MTKAMTITANMKNGEVAYFSVIPSGTIEQFLNDIEWVSCPEDVVEMANDGAWSIV
jgi:hypothetical protein